MRFLIFAPPYDQNSGGVIALHKLCHLLNLSGYAAYIVPYFPQYELHLRKKKTLINFFGNYLRTRFAKFNLNSSFLTPIYRADVHSSDYVIYSETVFGNPLMAENVIRWLLHKPGNFSGKVFYGENEIYFKFDHGLVGDFEFPGSYTHDLPLNIWHIPTEFYNLEDLPGIRDCTAYSIRKGVNKQYDKHASDAICIDGLSHQEIANIFKRSSVFISYDTYSAYSTFAVLCGCRSIVVPDEGISRDSWYPDKINQAGIAYGQSDIERAIRTTEDKVQHVLSKETRQKELVKTFAKTVINYFGV